MPLAPIAPSFQSAVVCGAGAAGLLHAIVLRSAGVRVVGVFDPDADRARAFAEMTGTETYAREDALWDADAQIACITSPPPFHVAQAARAARPGRVVFVEKPLATTLEDLERLGEVPWCVPIVQWRAGRALRAVRAAIARGELGPAPTVSVDLAWSRDDAYFASAGRGSLRAWGCGVLLSVGIHALDAVCWALGKPVVSARGRAGVGGRRGVDVATSATALLVFEGGAMASVRATFDAGPDVTRISFAGNGATAIIEGGEVDPTASDVRWSSAEGANLRRFCEIETNSGGATASPLLVPFLMEALKSLGRGASPGDCDELPNVKNVLDAHRVALQLDATRSA